MGQQPQLGQPKVTLQVDRDAAAYARRRQQPVDISQAQSGIGDRQADRLGGELCRRRPVDLAERCHAKATDHRPAGGWPRPPPGIAGRKG
jgi:hypothetical protein